MEDDFRMIVPIGTRFTVISDNDGKNKRKRSLQGKGLKVTNVEIGKIEKL